MKILGNKSKISAIALVLVLTIAATLISCLPASAVVKAVTQDTPTPEEWIYLLTQTAGGAWRPEPGVTKYPWLVTPAGNPAQTGYTDSPAPRTNHMLWRADIPFPLWVCPGIQDGAVYYVNVYQGAVFAFDAYTGQVLWQYYDVGFSTDTAHGMSSERWMQLAPDLVFTGVARPPSPVGTNRSAISTIALSAKAGSLMWTSPDVIAPALICPVGTVFSGGAAVYLRPFGGGNLTCYKLTYPMVWIMTKMWTNNVTVGRVSYSDGMLYSVTGYSRSVLCLNASTGDLIWNYTTPDPKDTFYAHPAVADGKVFLETDSQNPATMPVTDLIVLDAKTGDFLWKYDTGEYFSQTVSVGYGRAYFVGGSENKLYCLDVTTGQLLWAFEAPGVLDYYNPILADGKVYFVCAAKTITGFPLPGTYAGYTYCINATTGDEIWKYETPSTASNLGLADGNLYTATTFDYVWCWGQGPTTTDVSVTSSQLTSDQSVVVSGSVTDMSPFSQQHPELQSPLVAGVPVVLSYVEDGTWIDFATVNTASDGTFMYTWTPPGEGIYTVIARFEGNDAYQWSSGKTTVQVSPAPAAADYTPMFAGIIAAVVVAIVIGIVNLYALRKRK